MDNQICYTPGNTSPSGIFLLASSGEHSAAATALPKIPVLFSDLSEHKLELSDAALRNKIADLLAMTNQRLTLMPEIAGVKKALGIPLSDLSREQEVLESAGKAAQAIHLSKALADRFMQGQIEAGKRLQNKVQTSAALEPAQAEQKLVELRRKVSTLTIPILEALADIAGKLQYQAVVREIDRQLGQQPARHPLHDPNIAQPVHDALHTVH